MTSLRDLFSVRVSAATSRESSTKSLVVLGAEATRRGRFRSGIINLLCGLNVFPGHIPTMSNRRAPLYRYPEAVSPLAPKVRHRFRADIPERPAKALRRRGFASAGTPDGGPRLYDKKTADVYRGSVLESMVKCRPFLRGLW